MWESEDERDMEGEASEAETKDAGSDCGVRHPIHESTTRGKRT